MTARSADTWASGEPYELYVGRWSRRVAGELVRWLEVPPRRRWLDVGCGTGALSQVVLELADPSEVVGVDPSEGFVAHAAESVSDARARFQVGDAQRLSFGDGEFDAVVSGLVLNFIPDPAVAVSEMSRVAAEGVVAAYVWDYAEGMELMRHFWDAAAELDPAAAELDEGRRFALARPEPLGELFEAAGLADVQTRAIDVPTRFRDFDDYWTPFLGGEGPAPSYAMSLDDEQRGRLREALRRRLPTQPDGAIDLTARAWAVRGRA